ncbi:IS6 family transposase [Streptomyces sp. W007]|nr:ISL3 family transposase [Streptomyces sp. W007]EHM30428.1 IS6 family transposase [Streptomyces sp. W007]
MPPNVPATAQLAGQFVVIAPSWVNGRPANAVGVDPSRSLLPQTSCSEHRAVDAARSDVLVALFTTSGSGPTSVVCLPTVIVGFADRSREIVWKLLVPIAVGLMVLTVREVLLRLEELLFLADPGIRVESVKDDGEVIRVGARCGTVGARCPGCGTWSRRVHGSYLRFPADLPVAGRRVVLRLRVRRFTCKNISCRRRTFVEQIAGLTRRYSQRTERMRSVLAEVGLALAGRAGARLADVVGASVSRNTVLRLVSALPEPQPHVPRVVGVDEYAMRKGRVYGTVLVDVETRRPVDLLPDREAGTVAAWLADRPGIEVVCRDRAPFFAEGARIGAPTAVQVADRFHLWRNLGEAAERCVSRHRPCLRATSAESAPAPEPAESGSPWPTGHRFADRTRAKHATIHTLLAAGHSRRSIQRQLGMTYRTVQRLADAARPEDLFQGQWQNRRTKLDDFKPYLHGRWAEGCTNAWTLWEEIKTHGYTGGYGAVRAHLQPFRTSPTAPAARPPSPRTVTGWILTHPDTLPESEHLKLKSVLAGCPELDALAGHVRAFGKMLTQLQGEQLPQWIKGVRADDLPSLHTFVNGLERDLAAVTAGLTLPWSSGIVEGHVNRIKMIKRQMYGRAGFGLLRKRVLLAS